MNSSDIYSRTFNTYFFNILSLLYNISTLQHVIISIETGGVGRSPTVSPQENSPENKEVDLPIGTLEKMKDLMISIEKAAAMLETGLRSGDIYSTNAEDYLDVDLKDLKNDNVDGNNLDN